MGESGSSETRQVSLELLKSGVQLRVGQKSVLVVDRHQTNAPFAVEVQLTAAGGTPLAGERVRIIDPDTNEQVGQPVTTDKRGVLRAGVPEQKEYQFFPVADEPVEPPDPWSAHGPAATIPQEHSLLFVVLTDESAQPLKGEKVNVKDESGSANEVVTDDDGHVRLTTDPGVYELEVRGKTFVAHTLFTTDLGDEPQPYRFTLA
jgi:carboxypeptidase family protein